jgi:HSP20 family protein
MRYLAERPNRTTSSNGSGGSLLDFPRSVEDMFHRFWGGLPSIPSAAWQPAAEVLETPQAYVLHLEIPGIDPDLVDVTLTGEVLTVRAEKPMREKTDDETWLFNERGSGRFERSFTLPSVASAKDIEAEARHGVLTIRVPKAKEAQPMRVQVKKG